MTTGIGLGPVAKKIAKAQLRKNGQPPDEWLRHFGAALNLGAGAPGGLALGMAEDDEEDAQGKGQLPWYYQLEVESLAVEGLHTGWVVWVCCTGVPSLAGLLRLRLVGKQGSQQMVLPPNHTSSPPSCLHLPHCAAAPWPPLPPITSNWMWWAMATKCRPCSWHRCRSTP